MEDPLESPLANSGDARDFQRFVTQKRRSLGSDSGSRPGSASSLLQSHGNDGSGSLHASSSAAGGGKQGVAAGNGRPARAKTAGAGKRTPHVGAEVAEKDKPTSAGTSRKTAQRPKSSGAGTPATKSVITIPTGADGGAYGEINGWTTGFPSMESPLGSPLGDYHDLRDYGHDDSEGLFQRAQMLHYEENSGQSPPHAHPHTHGGHAHARHQDMPVGGDLQRRFHAHECSTSNGCYGPTGKHRPGSSKHKSGRLESPMHSPLPIDAPSPLLIRSGVRATASSASEEGQSPAEGHEYPPSFKRPKSGHPTSARRGRGASAEGDEPAKGTRRGDASPSDDFDVAVSTATYLYMDRARRRRQQAKLSQFKLSSPEHKSAALGVSPSMGNVSGPLSPGGTSPKTRRKGGKKKAKARADGETRSPSPRRPPKRPVTAPAMRPGPPESLLGLLDTRAASMRARPGFSHPQPNDDRGSDGSGGSEADYSHWRSAQVGEDGAVLALDDEPREPRPDIERPGWTFGTFGTQRPSSAPAMFSDVQGPDLRAELLQRIKMQSRVVAAQHRAAAQARANVATRTCWKEEDTHASSQAPVGTHVAAEGSPQPTEGGAQQQQGEKPTAAAEVMSSIREGKRDIKGLHKFLVGGSYTGPDAVRVKLGETHRLLDRREKSSSRPSSPSLSSSMSGTPLAAKSVPRATTPSYARPPSSAEVHRADAHNVHTHVHTHVHVPYTPKQTPGQRGPALQGPVIMHLTPTARWE